jgi:hypothetical protein
MGAKSITIVRAVTADFFFDCRAAEVPSDERISDVPWGVHNHEQDLRLESFQNLNVGGGSSAPQLYTIGPDGFEYGFIVLNFELILNNSKRINMAARDIPLRCS